MIEFDTKVVDIINRTHNVKSFRFETNDEASFKPGQFFFVTIKVSGEEKSKHFSFSNSPTEKGFLEFTKRMTGSPFSSVLDSMKIGDWARIKMPYGFFTFEGEHEKVAFLSGGIGITPIRSMCKFAIDRKLPSDIVLLYGNSTEEDIIFRQDFDDMEEKADNLRVVYTLTSPGINTDIWNGRTGYIDDKMIREEMADYGDRVFYLCGPPAMVGNMAAMLKDKLGIQRDKIRTENFTGY